MLVDLFMSGRSGSVCSTLLNFGSSFQREEIE